MRATTRLGLSSLLALGALAAVGFAVRFSFAHPLPPPPGDPLAAAAPIGLNQAWYFQHAAEGPPVSPSPIAPARPPASAPPARSVTSATLEPRAYLPLVQRSGMVEARALWVTRWGYTTTSDVQSLAANAAGAGFNMLLFQIRGVADAFYTPGLEPWAARLSGGTLGQDPGWDPLQTAVEAAHANGLELHAYVNAYTVWVGTRLPPSDTVPVHLFWTLSQRYPQDEWRAWTSAGPMQPSSGYLWATPALTDVVDRVVSVTADLVTRYDVDGVHLDLLRYPGRAYSHDPFTEAALAEAGLPRDEWQRQRVGWLVGRVASEVIPLRPGLRLSAAVWPVYRDRWGWGYSEGYDDYYQDSQGWMLGGTVDAIMPMIYPADVVAHPDVFTPTQFSLLVADFLGHDGGRHVFPGISAQYENFDEIAQRIAIARELGAPGHAIFSARLVRQNDHWGQFAAGPYATPATVPPLTWRP